MNFFLKLTGSTALLASMQTDKKEPVLVRRWNESNWSVQSYDVSLVSSVMPASSGGDAICTGCELLKKK